MIKKITHLLLILLIFAMFTSCQDNSEEKQIEKAATAFANAYFNWHFEECSKYVTEDSKNCLRFLASNVTQGDVDSLRSAETAPTIEIDETSYDENSTAKAKIHIRDFYYTNNIGHDASFQKEATATINLKKVDQRWIVDMQNGLVVALKDSFDSAQTNF